MDIKPQKDKDTDKTFKLVIAGSVVLVSISLFYYFVIFSSQKEQTRVEEKQQAKIQDCLDKVEKSYLSAFKQVLELEDESARVDTLRSLNSLNEQWEQDCYSKK